MPIDGIRQFHSPYGPGSQPFVRPPLNSFSSSSKRQGSMRSEDNGSRRSSTRAIAAASARRYSAVAPRAAARAPQPEGSPGGPSAGTATAAVGVSTNGKLAEALTEDSS